MEALVAVIVIDCSVGPAAALIVKFTPLCDAPLMATLWLAGEKVTPDFAGVMV